MPKSPSISTLDLIRGKNGFRISRTHPSGCIKSWIDRLNEDVENMCTAFSEVGLISQLEQLPPPPLPAPSEFESVISDIEDIFSLQGGGEQTSKPDSTVASFLERNNIKEHILSPHEMSMISGIMSQKLEGFDSPEAAAAASARGKRAPVPLPSVPKKPEAPSSSRCKKKPQNASGSGTPPPPPSLPLSTDAPPAAEYQSVQHELEWSSGDNPWIRKFDDILFNNFKGDPGGENDLIRGCGNKTVITIGNQKRRNSPYGRPRKDNPYASQVFWKPTDDGGLQPSFHIGEQEVDKEKYLKTVFDFPMPAESKILEIVSDVEFQGPPDKLMEYLSKLGERDEELWNLILDMTREMNPQFSEERITEIATEAFKKVLKNNKQNSYRKWRRIVEALLTKILKVKEVIKLSHRKEKQRLEQLGRDGNCGSKYVNSLSTRLWGVVAIVIQLLHKIIALEARVEELTSVIKDRE